MGIQRIVKISILVALLAFLAPVALYAQQTTEGTAESVMELPEADSRSFIEISHATLSDGITSLAQQIDQFLSGNSDWEEKNRTYLELNQKGKLGFENDYKIFVRGRLELPKTKRRFNLFFENMIDNELRTPGIVPKGNIEEDETHSGLRSLVYGGKDRPFHSSVKVGVKTKGFDFDKLDPFVETRLRLKVKPTSRSIIEGNVQPIAFVQRGVGMATGLNFDYSPYRDWLFRLSHNSSWYRENQFTELTHGLGIFQTLSKSKVLSYGFGVGSTDSGGVHATGYSASVGYTQKIIWDWLRIETTGQLSFPKDQNFRRQFLFGVLLQARFGSV